MIVYADANAISATQAAWAAAKAAKDAANATSGLLIATWSGVFVSACVALAVAMLPVSEARRVKQERLLMANAALRFALGGVRKSFDSLHGYGDSVIGRNAEGLRTMLENASATVNAAIARGIDDGPTFEIAANLSALIAGLLLHSRETWPTEQASTALQRLAPTIADVERLTTEVDRIWVQRLKMAGARFVVVDPAGPKSPAR
jgi:hypothetical protein